MSSVPDITWYPNFKMSNHKDTDPTALYAVDVRTVSPNNPLGPIRTVIINGPKTISAKADIEIRSYLQQNSLDTPDSILSDTASFIAGRYEDEAFNRELGTYTQDGLLEKYIAPSSFEAWESIPKTEARLAGIDVGLAPDSTPILASSTVIKQQIDDILQPTKQSSKLNPYKDINNPQQDLTMNLKDTIGGADLSVFFIMSYPVLSADNASLPLEAQEKEFVILELDNVLSLSYSIMREKFPVRNMGEVNPAAILNGIRSISGHIAFTIFADDTLAYLRGQITDRIKQIESRFNEFFGSSYTPLDKVQGPMTEKGQSDFWNNVDPKQLQWESFKEYYTQFLYKTDKVQLLDSLPPFHILVLGVNDRGVFSKLLIKDISIIDENQYHGTQNPHIMNKITFTALDIIPMAKFSYDANVIATLDSVDESIVGGKYGSTFNFINEMTGNKVLNDLQSMDRLKNPLEVEV
jgi:hypothetical protein